MIEISCDLGEAQTPEELAVERELWTMVDAASVACGGHVGDEQSMRRCVELAGNRGVILGAHPSYPDRENFGRKSMKIERPDLIASLREQVAALRAIALQSDVRLERVKPHGALYNDAHGDEALAEAIIDALIQVDAELAIVTSPASAVERMARRRGVRVVREAFADRRYTAAGALVPRSDPRSLLLDYGEAAAQAVSLATEGKVTAIDGSVIDVPHETICVHGDMPGAVERLKMIRKAIASNDRRGS